VKADEEVASELHALEQKLEEALAKFQRMPGAMWLATSSIIEAAGRLPAGPRDEGLTRRSEEMLVRARKARDDAGPRSSEHDVSAITAWLELAQKRAPLEIAVKEALVRVAEHRRAHPAFGHPPTNREELEKEMAARELDVVERMGRLAVPVPANAAALVQTIRANDPELDPSLLDDTELWTRGAAANARLARVGMKERWSLAPFPSARALIAFAFASSLGLLACAYELGQATGSTQLVAIASVSAAVVGLGLLAWAYARRGRERANQEAMSDCLAFRERDEGRLAGARRDQELLVLAARALGSLDAFGATDDGRALEARESRLVALAPWIRETVGGFTSDEVKRFAP
jgi:hypothetical protein